jgi:NADH:ubiquinone oxidoreductase subunit E
MEGVPVRFIWSDATQFPAYMDAGVAALKHALLRAKVNVYSQDTVELLSCLQNVHDVFGIWEWDDRLRSIARQFGLSAHRLQQAA